MIIIRMIISFKNAASVFDPRNGSGVFTKNLFSILAYADHAPNIDVER